MKDFLAEEITKISERKYHVIDIKDAEDNPLFNEFAAHDAQSNVLIIYGENASGKSLFSTIIERVARDQKIACRSACMRNRTTSGVARALIFGDESAQSTGATSINVAKNAINSTLKDEGDALAILDEPDVGLSCYYAPAMGQFIAEQFLRADESKGLILVSHSKKLISSFRATYKKDVSTLGINTSLSLDDWLARTSTATVEELLALDEIAKNKEITILREMKK